MRAESRLEADAVGLSLRQFSEAWKVMCSPAPRFEREVGDGVEYTFSGVPIAFFNVALLTERGISGDALARHAERASAWASGRQVPWLLVVTHDVLQPDVEPARVLDACGLAPAMPLTGMVAHQIAPSARPAADLQLDVPDDEHRLGMLLDINSQAYGMDLEAGKGVMAQPAFWTGHVPSLGSVAGNPASCAAVLMVDGIRYVALVATAPPLQRKGYGEAAMRHALDVARDRFGDAPSVLHATDAGRPIYERMGYQPIASHTVFMETRFLH
jgi:GNAT superfamily N-acetyltransferase